MDFSLTREQALVKKMMQAFTENEVKPIAAEIDRTHQYPAENVAKLFKLGVMGMTVPKEYGGMGADQVAAAICTEELAKACASTSDWARQVEKCDSCVVAYVTPVYPISTSQPTAIASRTQPATDTRVGVAGFVGWVVFGADGGEDSTADIAESFGCRLIVCGRCMSECVVCGWRRGVHLPRRLKNFRKK